MARLFNWDACEWFFLEGVKHFEKSAPTVSAYLDDLYVRLKDDPSKVCLREVLRVQQLQDDAGSWMNPHVAANHVYKLQCLLGQKVVGHAGF